MSSVFRWMAAGPWITRDLKEAVLAADYDQLEMEAGTLGADNNDLRAQLVKIAAIAHDGGLCGMSEGDALVAIRRLTLAHWVMSGTESERAARASFPTTWVQK